jgi:two-component system LytT family sensor kinase
MSGKLSQKTAQISVELATKTFQLKSTIIRNEFNGLIRGLNATETMMAKVHSKNDFTAMKSTMEILLLNHPKINNGWYAIAKQGDTVYQSIQKNGALYQHHPIQDFQKTWISRQLKSADSLTKTVGIVSVKDSLHWIVASKHRLPDSSLLIFGLDINLQKLQRYFWSVDTIGRATAFITNEQGYYISNPNEELIGTKVPVDTSLSVSRTFLADSVSSYEIVNSAYLQLPVVRYYTPLHIASMHWTMVVDTPVLIVDEDLKIIEKYVTALFISAAVLILLLIAWAQTKWQKEFMLRQQAEMKRQEVSIEKQALSIVAERQQKENALLQLNTLKEKVNPHFLFNSLSSLNALIAQNPELAKSFVVKLSRVYRYVLESYPNGLATVAEELNFVREYFFLMKIRFGEALQPLEIHISDAQLQEKIPFMSLQTLIENAVKHNMISKTKPLHLKIESLGDHIVVTNNLQLRNDVKGSGKQGLNYLQSTYAYFGAEKIRYGVEGNAYKCYLPLIRFTP